ncbi:MAG: ferric reductase-like transmembrane domain-containing protein [Marmoricola sp.]
MTHAELTKALWDLSRATGLVATCFFAAAIVLGIRARSGRAIVGLGRFGVNQLHRTLALTGVGLIAIHVTTLLFDPYAQLKLLDVALPFHATYRPFWLGLGTLGADLLVVVVVVALLRHRVGPRVFRVTHWAVYALFPIAVIHGLGTGTDAGTVWSESIVAVAVTAVLIAIGWRMTEHFAERGMQRIPRLVARWAVR